MILDVVAAVLGGDATDGSPVILIAPIQDGVFGGGSGFRGGVGLDQYEVQVVHNMLHKLMVKSVGFLKDHAGIVQAGNEAAAVDFLAAARPVREPYDVGAVLLKSGGEGQSLAVVDQRHVSRLAV